MALGEFGVGVLERMGFRGLRLADWCVLGVNIVTGWQAAEYEQMSKWVFFLDKSRNAGALDCL